MVLLDKAGAEGTKRFLGDILAAASDIVIPRSCELCGLEADGSANLCWNCLSRLWTINDPICSICGNPAFGDITSDYVCNLCRRRRPQYDIARSALHYDGPGAMLIRRFKYRDCVHLGEDMGLLIEKCLRAACSPSSIDLVTYVPLHHAKQRSRTYNQAELLAASVASKIGRPVSHRLLSRTRETGTQTLLSAEQRRRNVSGAFRAVSPRWTDGRRILLVDDVMTTGATLNECAKVLKRAGAVSVMCATAGRGVG